MLGKVRIDNLNTDQGPADTAEETLLQVRDLNVSFPLGRKRVSVVRSISFDLADNTVLGIVGESGCGKSVTGNSLTRITEAEGARISGEVLYRGADILTMNREELGRIRGNGVAYIMQDAMHALNPVETIGRQFLRLLAHHGRTSSRDEVTHLLEAVGLPNPADWLDAFPTELSGGMCQRVMIAMALCMNPRLLVADEPTSGLDMSTKVIILELIRKIRRERSPAILLITHDIGFAQRICDGLLVMYLGKMVEYGPSEGILKNPRHPYTRGLLASIPSLHHFKPKFHTIPGSPGNIADWKEGCPFFPRCEYRRDECALTEPPLKEIEPDHWAACPVTGGSP